MSVISSGPPRQVLGQIDWRAGILAGLIGGAAFMMIEMGMVALFQGESPWGPPRMIAAIVLGQGVLPQPGTPAIFGLMVMMTAMVVHFMLAVIYGLIGAALASRLGYGGAIALGAVCGLAIYLINFYPVASAWFPWFAMGRGWISAFAHVMFGAVIGAAYVWLRRPHTPRTK